MGLVAGLQNLAIKIKSPKGNPCCPMTVSVYRYFLKLPAMTRISHPNKAANGSTNRLGWTVVGLDQDADGVDLGQAALMPGQPASGSFIAPDHEYRPVGQLGQVHSGRRDFPHGEPGRFDRE